MIKRMPTHSQDDTYASCIVAGDTIYLSHHAGGFDKDDVAHQMQKTFENLNQTLASVGATLDDMVQIHLYLKDIGNFQAARDVFHRYFRNGVPARMTTTTQFVEPACLCMVDGIAIKQHP